MTIKEVMNNFQEAISCLEVIKMSLASHSKIRDEIDEIISKVSDLEADLKEEVD